MTELTDRLKTKTLNDFAKTLTKKLTVKCKDTIMTSNNLGIIIAMFSDAEYNVVVSMSSTDIYRMLMRNGLQVFFSQRYQGDQFLNWVFNYF